MTQCITPELQCVPINIEHEKGRWFSQDVANEQICGNCLPGKNISHWETGKHDLARSGKYSSYAPESYILRCLQLPLPMSTCKVVLFLKIALSYFTKHVSLDVVTKQMKKFSSIRFNQAK